MYLWMDATVILRERPSQNESNSPAANNSYPRVLPQSSIFQAVRGRTTSGAMPLMPFSRLEGCAFCPFRIKIHLHPWVSAMEATKQIQITIKMLCFCNSMLGQRRLRPSSQGIAQTRIGRQTSEQYTFS
jgi:hypothetical protein